MPAKIKNEQAAALKILLLRNKEAFNGLYLSILQSHGCSEKTHFIDLNSCFINAYPLPRA